MTTIPQVYSAINAVQASLSAVGISKDRKNTQPGANYQFRGIDDVLNALSPLLAEHKLVILPRVLRREFVERQAKSGNALFYVTVQCEFDIVSATDGSKHTVSTFGEAMDSGDKATNKAMSAAYKYMAIQSFAIPTEGDNDADATTHQVAPYMPPGLLESAQEAASAGRASFQTFWKACSASARTALMPHIDTLKDAVSKAEEGKE